jgi:hypothetical protein
MARLSSPWQRPGSWTLQPSPHNETDGTRSARTRTCAYVRYVTCATHVTYRACVRGVPPKHRPGPARRAPGSRGTAGGGGGGWARVRARGADGVLCGALRGFGCSAVLCGALRCFAGLRVLCGALRRGRGAASVACRSGRGRGEPRGRAAASVARRSGRGTRGAPGTPTMKCPQVVDLPLQRPNGALQRKAYETIGIPDISSVGVRGRSRLRY